MTLLRRISGPLLLLALPVILSCSDPEGAPFQTTAPVPVHPADWLKVGSVDFHGRTLARQNYDFAACKQCHGTRYDGGLVEVSCLTCHNKPGGPEACNTCHGDFNADPADFAAIAPPRGLDGETEETDAAVGAHQHHLEYFASAEATCGECHTVPPAFNSPGHIDATPGAEVSFPGTLVKTATEGGLRQPAPAFDAATNSCNNAYCHGNWGLLKAQSQFVFIYASEKIEGNTASPVWNDEESAACGTCHDLPPKGHNPFELSACVTCHQGVIDQTGVIIDKTKHINGKINVFGQEFPMF